LYSVPRAVNNVAAIGALLDAQSPKGQTPTAPAIDAIVADFAANPPPQGSPPIIVLASDGLPNACGANTDTRADAVAAAANAYNRGIKLLVLAIGNLPGTAEHFQDLANAGQGVRAGQPDAALYAAPRAADMVPALQSLVRLVLPCSFELTARIDATGAQAGNVTLNGTRLTYGTSWMLDADGITIHLLGNACNVVQDSPNPVVEATFACPAVREANPGRLRSPLPRTSSQNS
jgi:hypothetical protein